MGLPPTAASGRHRRRERNDKTGVIMTVDLNDTIVALATPRAAAPRGIVRLSGPRVSELVQECVVDSVAWVRRARRYEVTWRCPEPVGEVPLVLYFWPDARSYTGEPAAELHAVGCQPVLDALIAGCLEHGARLARPGEFTLRAFLAGRIDLTQAEAVLSVIEAEDLDRLAAALKQLAGGVGHPIQHLRTRLLGLLAHLEAELDFADEEIDFLPSSEVARELRSCIDQIEELREQLGEQQRADGVYRVAVVGEPNVGKSSLVNALAGREAALVSNRAGTTRDPVSVRVQWKGLSIELLDTAGEEPVIADAVGQAAQRLRENVTRASDLQLWCVPADASRVPARRPEKGLLLVRTCADRVAARSSSSGWWVSSWTGEGLETLREQIVTRLQQRASSLGGGLHVRCRSGLERAAQTLRRAERLAEEGQGQELVALELREALASLGELVGEVYTEELLDEIFGRFCIGK